MCGQRSSRAMAFWARGAHGQMTKSSGAHSCDLRARVAYASAMQPQQPQRTIISAALAPLFLSSRSTKIVCCDNISCAQNARMRHEQRSRPRRISKQAQHAMQRWQSRVARTHVAHDGKLHVLRRRHAHRQAAPQEEPDVREALRRARVRHQSNARGACRVTCARAWWVHTTIGATLRGAILPVMGM